MGRLADRIAEVDGAEGVRWVLDRIEINSETIWRIKTLAEDHEVDVPVVSVAKTLTDRARQSRRNEVPRAFEDLRKSWMEPGRSPVWPGRWVHETTAREIRKAWGEVLWSDDAEWMEDGDGTKGNWLWKLGMALGRRPKLCPIGPVITRAHSWEGDRNPFARMLSEACDERVRTLGLDLIANGNLEDGLDLLNLNAEPGDEEFALATAARCEGDDEAHSAVMSLSNIYKRCPDRRLLLHVYEHSPCSFCRESSVRDLIDAGELPEDIAEECLYDCVDDTRELARGALAQKS
jgi:hypothetical protein